MEYFYFFIRIFICFVLGIIIGIERQCRRKTAGVRTVTLVGLGAFLFASISHQLKVDDITRIAAQIVSGIGFLGAGVILRAGEKVKGLNTAATLWCSAAIGTLIALGLVIEAIFGVIYILMSNILLRFISIKMKKKSVNKSKDNYNLIIICEKEKQRILRKFFIEKFKRYKTMIRKISTREENSQTIINLVIEIERIDSSNICEIINELCLETGVVFLEYNLVNKYSYDDDDDYDGNRIVNS